MTCWTVYDTVPAMTSSSLPQARLLDSDETAAYLHINADTLSRWVRQGKLRGYDLPRGRRFKLEDIDAFLERYSSLRKIALKTNDGTQ